MHDLSSKSVVYTDGHDYEEYIEDMKRLILKFGMFMLLAGMLVACGDQENPVEPRPRISWDATPIVFYIHIKNSDGIDLLDSTKHDTFLQKFSVKYGGRKYMIATQMKQAGSRYYMPIFYGLQLGGYWNHETLAPTGSWYLVFGEFDGAETEDYSIVFQLGDKLYDLSCTNVVGIRSDGYPNVNRRYYFNGELLTDDAGKMGRYHFLYTSSGDLEYVPSEYE